MRTRLSKEIAGATGDFRIEPGTRIELDEIPVGENPKGSWALSRYNISRVVRINGHHLSSMWRMAWVMRGNAEDGSCLADISGMSRSMPTETEEAL